MDTNTGKIYTAKEVARKMKEVMDLTLTQPVQSRRTLTGDYEDFGNGILYPSPFRPGKASRARLISTDVKRSADDVKMSVDDFMAKFMPDMKPLKRLPKKSCKKCHGKGYTGRNTISGKYVPCVCTQ